MKNYKNVCSKEDLIRHYIKERLPVSKIAMKYGVTHKTMAKAMIFHGVSIRGRISSNQFLRDKKWLKKKYLEEKLSVRAISEECGGTRGNVYSALKYAGIPMRTVKEGIALTNRMGPASGNWKGGRRLAGARGKYIQILTHGHPWANADNYVMEHRLIMEKKLGRYLTKNEIVHHKDGNGHNNKISNLQLTTKKKHFQDHFDGVKSVKKHKTSVKDLKKEIIRLKKLLDENGILY